MITIENITMRHLSTLRERAAAAGLLKLEAAARRAEGGVNCDTALRRCVAALNGESAEGRRLVEFERAGKKFT